MMVSSKLHNEWERDALLQLKQYRGQAEGKVILSCEFYHKDLRKRDLDNELSTIQDVLVKAGLLLSDDCFTVEETHAIFGGIDKNNPRVIIIIEEIEGEL